MRTTLNEVEKFYINQNYNTMSIEKLQGIIKEVDPNTIKAYVLNMPTPPEKPQAEPPPTPPKPPNPLDNLYGKRPGIVIQTKESSTYNDEAKRLPSPPTRSTPKPITTLRSQ